MRMMLHVHDLYWTSMSISQLIEVHYVRADIPDPFLEPELYFLPTTLMQTKFMWWSTTCRNDMLKGFPLPYFTYYKA